MTPSKKEVKKCEHKDATCTKGCSMACFHDVFYCDTCGLFLQNPTPPTFLDRASDELWSKFKRIYILDDVDGQELLLRAKDNKALFSIDVTKEVESFLASKLTEARGEVIEQIKQMNNFRQAKVDGKEDWNDALEQSARKVDALLAHLTKE